MAHKIISVSTPGAGAEFGSTVPAGKYWSIKAGSFIFTSDATPATRQVRLQLDDGTNVYFISDSEVGQAASLAIRYSFFQGSAALNAGPATATPRILTFPPGVLLLPGSRLISTTSSIQATDAYTSIRLWVDERDLEYGHIHQGNLVPWAV